MRNEIRKMMAVKYHIISRMGTQKFNFHHKWPNLQDRLQIIFLHEFYAHFFTWMIFFVQFLVFQIVTFSHFVLKKTRVFFPRVEIIFFLHLYIVKRLGSWGGAPVRGAGGQAVKKIAHIWKTKNRTKKKLFMQKMSTRSIPIYPANLATFEESWILGRPKRPFWMATAPKREWNFMSVILFLHIAHL